MLELHPLIKQGANIGIKPDFTEQSLSWTLSTSGIPRMKNVTTKYCSAVCVRSTLKMCLFDITTVLCVKSWMNQHPKLNSVGFQRLPDFNRNTGYQNTGVLWDCRSLRIHFHGIYRWCKGSWDTSGHIKQYSNCVFRYLVPSLRIWSGQWALQGSSF